ncbi:PepSY-associated TM helix domain-containing protein [Parasphingorhabdus sp. JC815]|uniref:PepSY-associated TM helix domain-containing protein n=1 Tax=Parasphingorhabdus sp. JC815 TaxID=3232140 RepID=UPI0034598CF0
MKAIAWIHRWAGGIIGLILAILGLTGTLLLWKGAWIALSVPGAGNAVTAAPAELADVTQKIVDGSDDPIRYIRFADNDVNVHIVSNGPKSGFYTDSSGTVLAAWDNVWGRVETALFEIHHYLLLGETGTTISGLAALIGLGFVITGVILWWPTRKTFKLRLWPARMTRPSIIRQHRDLGVILAPLLFLGMLTGVAMTLRPVANFLLSPISSPAEMEAAREKPEFNAGSAENADWQTIMAKAQARYPDAIIRLISFPRAEGDPITIRMKQPAEWHNNGRTMLWFDGANGSLVGDSDALKLPQGLQIYNFSYPLHAAKVGGIIYIILQTLTGLALTLLGTLAVWSFWFRRKKKPAKRNMISDEITISAHSSIS